MAVIVVAAGFGVVALRPTAGKPVEGNIAPSPPPSASASVAALPLVPFTPPTFPYTPTWTPGAYNVDYDDHGGVKQFGVSGTQLNFWPSSSVSLFTIVFVSNDKPHIDGHVATATIQGRAARVVTGVTLPNYKFEEIHGTVVSWRSAAGPWITLGISGNAATAVHDAGLLVRRALPVTTGLAPSVIPAGMHLASTLNGKLVIESNDPALGMNILVEGIDGEGGPPENMGLYALPPGTQQIWYTFLKSDKEDYVRIEATGPHPFDIAGFAAHMQTAYDNGVDVPSH
jgi:hypothetical protein